MTDRGLRLSDSGGSKDMEEEATDDAMRAMLGAQEYHEVGPAPSASLQIPMMSP